jgi:outer membrane protein
MEKNNNSIAKLALVLSGILLIAVIFLWVNMPKSTSVEEEADTKLTDTAKVEKQIVDDGELKIAFFYSDSLSSRLEFMKELEKDIAAAQKSAEAKMMKKQREIEAWQKKWAAKGQLLSSEEQEFMKQRQQMEQDAMQFEQQVQMTFAQEQERLLRLNIDRITAASKKYAEENGIDMVLSYQLGQSVYYGSPVLDITDELIEQMNAEFNETFAGAEEEK